ncbi:AAA family ATPase [Mycobacterium yunnanensis]|uniref:AAA family ATPase n=1 Tax=Mycobacterium yunnanensis TaxID=368477 RepID=A0A9X2Z7Z8_9MYCO|nr:LuxR family transcriptional regulator [Mycobacterium yunnanensis]MCV7424304.1 AAA family ATPase [Mycobacterium yunnanensis]
MAKVLHGRAGECAALRELLTRVGTDESRVLVLRGEAGVGKSALLDYVVDEANDFALVQVSGVESDMELAYAGLQQLCAPLMDRVEDVPEPQREALSVAFGRGVGPAPDRFLVGLAVLSLMAAAAADRPLLCIVDDAQWLDQVSVQTLGFVARRLMAEPIAMIFAVRDGVAPVLEGQPELRIGGLSDAEARELLDSVVVGKIDARVRDRIVAETRGIPLALLEVPRNVTAADLAGGFGSTVRRTSATQIEDGFLRRIEALPESTRRLLLVAAAEPVGDAALFLRAAALLGIPVDALAPAEAAGVIEFGKRMRFHHPLMRSAAYRAADLTERREVHRALADATDPDAAPDRRAWHAANAASGPDDAVAADLETSAGRAQSRGGMSAAATFLERAAVLTSDPVLRGARAIAAAQAKREAAAPEAAYELLAIAELGPLSDLQRAQIARMRAQMEFVRSRSGEPGAPTAATCASHLLRAARGLDGIDDDAARDTYFEALTAAMYAGRLGEPGLLAAVAGAGRAAVERAGRLQRPVDLLLSGMTSRILDGPGAGADHMRSALELWKVHGENDDGRAVQPPFPIAQESAAHELWDDAVLQQIATDTVRRARDTGSLAVLAPALVYRAGVHVFSGEFGMAHTLIEEANAITAATGHTPVRYHSLNLAVWRGDPDAALRIISAAAAEGVERGEGRLIGVARFASAVLFNGLGRYEEALTAARECCDYEDLGVFAWCLFELVEAAAHLGDPATGASALVLLERRAAGSGTDWGLGVTAAARALLEPSDAAEPMFDEAVERLDRAGAALHGARARLSYGEWLRRVNRRVDARKQLNAAHEEFTRMGAAAFAERARRELVATGEKVRKRTPGADRGATGELTAQETQIARLAGDGMTNQEIGAQLFISTHTVEWHLRKVFVKLDITSRRQLRTISWAS